jgi:bifunctional UDP-N-acetylglucosamine pyrophosphorylase/glucosamine-1-phosphate N-acetyltransferase
LKAFAVVLAAGRGRRFWPYAEVRNKCAFPIANVPLVLRLVRQIQEIGIPHVVVVVGYEDRSIRAALREVAADVIYARQPATDVPGTSPAALAGIAAADDEAENILVVPGDVVVSTDDLRAIWKLHKGSAAIATALCSRLDGERPHDWMVAHLGQEPLAGGIELRGASGHGRGGEHRFTGIYALSPAALPYLAGQPSHMSHVPVGGMPPAEADISDALAIMADDGKRVHARLTTGKFVDLDKPWHILEAAEAVVEQMAQTAGETRIAEGAVVSDGADIEGPIYVEAGARIGKRVSITGPAWIGSNARVLNGAIVGRGTVIGANSRVSDYCLVSGGAVVGRRCVVGHGAEFEGVMLDGSYIYHYSEILGVLGEAVDIGAATVCGTLRFDDTETVHRINGRRELPRHGSNATYFGDYCRTGVNVITQPGVKIGNYTCVGPGIVVYKDIPDRKLILLKQETIEKDWGPERYGW